MRRLKETIEVDIGDNIAHSIDNKTNEIQCEYELIGDVVEDGVRLIKLKPSERNEEAQRKRGELLDALLGKLGERDSKAFAVLLGNAINEHGYDIVEEWHRKVLAQKEPVKIRKGCCQIIIGRGLSGNSRIGLRQ